MLARASLPYSDVFGDEKECGVDVGRWPWAEEVRFE